MQNQPDTKHPLESYFTLIEENYISVIYSEFHDFDTFYSSFDPTIFDTNELVWNHDQQAYILIEIDTRKVLQIHTLEELIHDYLSDYKRNFKSEVRKHLISMPQRDIDDWCKILQKEISILINKCKNVKKRELIIRSLESLDDFLSQYTSGTFISYKTDSSAMKLKWYGKINTLATLFYDLTNPDNKLKTSYLRFERNTISNFIANNFVDNTGKEIKADTINRSLNTNPTDTKKAKDRLTLSDKD